MHQMHKYAQFEGYAKLNWEPVQTLKHRSDVLWCSGASDESGGCILDPVAGDRLTTEEVLPEWSCSNPFWLSQKPTPDPT